MRIRVATIDDAGRARIAPALLALLFVVSVSRVDAQFLDGFEAGPIASDPKSVNGWSSVTGDGRATIDFRQGGDGFGSILVDATNDRRGIWWAVIRRKVSDKMDLDLLSRPGYELRIEARIRVSHAPRRVNLHLNTQRTTDFHSHLLEFDIPDTNRWHTISMTTRDFPAQPGDSVFGQLALIDWGLEKYRVDVDYFKVDVVEAARAGPDLGAAVPYHPPIPALRTFRQEARVVQDAIIDLDNPDVNLNNWYVQAGSAATGATSSATNSATNSATSGATRKRVLTVNGTQYVILRFDLSSFSGRQIAGHGLLELTTHSVQRTADPLKDFGIVRVVEILGGDPAWDQRTVTADSLRRGAPLTQVFNTQMIIDWPVTEGDGGKTYFTISQPVLQRMVDGRTLGIAIRALGSISASVYAMEQGPASAARLLFNVKE